MTRYSLIFYTFKRFRPAHDRQAFINRQVFIIDRFLLMPFNRIYLLAF
ncbi:MAG: hypothetical protein GPOALKHO_000380 [Sodalis sp.]|nr:MAG: hypothetical protein GPOALKHO_000380 [Sodalis sp.]